MIYHILDTLNILRYSGTSFAQYIKKIYLEVLVIKTM